MPETRLCILSNTFTLIFSMSTFKKTFLFDLNGTVIDDMKYHSEAWYHVLTQDLGADLSWEQVNSQMYGKNSEVLQRIFGENHFSAEETERLSVEKEKQYQARYKPHLKLINGLDHFLENAYKHDVQMAIASAAILFNVDFILDNLDIRHYFKALVSADDVKKSKPDPETFLIAAERLKAEPKDCVVFEDAPKGVEAAQNAGMACVVIKTAHTEDEFSKYSNVIAFVDDYTDPFIRNYFKKEKV